MISGKILRTYKLIHYAARRANADRRKLSKGLSKVINPNKSKRGFEPNLYKAVIGFYNRKKLISDHLDILSRNLDLYSFKYENMILIGDFNAEMNQPSMKSFCDSYTLTSLIKEPTCYKNLQNPSCIDLILTNSPYSFQNSYVVETGLSDFHKMTVTVMKTTYEKLKPKIKNYRDYKNFCNDTFRKVLLEKLSTENINANGSGFEKFLQICIQTLDIFAPYKKKCLQGDNMPFMNKSLARAHMKRSRLRNLYLKKKTCLYKVAQLLCFSLEKN